MTFWLIYAAVAAGIAVVTAVTTLRGARKDKVMRLGSDAMHERLAAWARTHGWDIAEGTDVRVADMLDRLSGLAGEPGDWDIRSFEGGLLKDGPEQPLKKWDYGAVLTRRAHAGRIALVSCWREGTADYYCLGALTARAGREPVAPFTIDRVAGGKLHVDGAPPARTPEVFARALRELGVPARLRMISDQIVILAPGPLTPTLAETMVARLAEIRDALPTPPGGGPLR